MKEREHRKYDLALIQAEVFRKRYILQDWSGSLISSLRPLVTPTSGSAGRRLSTIDNKWEGKGLILKVCMCINYINNNLIIIIPRYRVIYMKMVMC